MRIAIVSDTHGRHRELPPIEADLLLHCGDGIAGRGWGREALADLDAWFGEQAVDEVVCVGGNHDHAVQQALARGERPFVHARCLVDETVTVGGLRIHGAPWTPELVGWAFYRDAAELRRAWAGIPEDLDVLLTHTPAGGTLDRSSSGRSCGCVHLQAALERARPRLHAFGHIHASGGVARQPGGLAVNAAVIERGARGLRPPVLVDLEPGGRARLVDGRRWRWPWQAA